MSRDVWFFGDSFAHYIKQDYLQYHDIVNHHFKSSYHCYGLGGTSQEYTFYNISKTLPRIQNDDIIIIFLTDHARTWFFQDEPRKASAPQLLQEFRRDKQLYNFFQTYFSRLNHLEHVKKMQEEVFLKYLAFETQRMITKPIIIKNFDFPDYYIHPDLTYSIGTMLQVSKKEFNREDPMTDRNFLEFRRNHISKQNHKVLAEKIIQNVEEGSEIDLTTGFHEKIYNS